MTLNYSRFTLCRGVFIFLLLTVTVVEGSAVASGINKVTDSATGVANSIDSVAADSATGITNAVSDASNSVQAWVNTVQKGITSTNNAIQAKVKEKTQAALDAASNLGDSAKNAANNLINSVKNGVGTLKNAGQAALESTTLVFKSLLTPYVDPKLSQEELLKTKNTIIEGLSQNAQTLFDSGHINSEILLHIKTLNIVSAVIDANTLKYSAGKSGYGVGVPLDTAGVDIGTKLANDQLRETYSMLLGGIFSEDGFVTSKAVQLILDSTGGVQAQGSILGITAGVADVSHKQALTTMLEERLDHIKSLELELFLEQQKPVDQRNTSYITELTGAISIIGQSMKTDIEKYVELHDSRNILKASNMTATDDIYFALDGYNEHIAKFNEEEMVKNVVKIIEENQEALVEKNIIGEEEARVAKAYEFSSKLSNDLGIHVGTILTSLHQNIEKFGVTLDHYDMISGLTGDAPLKSVDSVEVSDNHAQSLKDSLSACYHALLGQTGATNLPTPQTIELALHLTAGSYTDQNGNYASHKTALEGKISAEYNELKILHDELSSGVHLDETVFQAAMIRYSELQESIRNIFAEHVRQTTELKEGELNKFQDHPYLDMDNFYTVHEHINELHDADHPAIFDHENCSHGGTSNAAILYAKKIIQEQKN